MTHLTAVDIRLAAQVLALTRCRLLERLRTFLRALRYLLCRLLRHDKRILDGLFAIYIVSIRLMTSLEILLELIILPVEAFIVIDDLIEELVDLILIIPAEAPLEFLVVNVHWCKQNENPLYLVALARRQKPKKNDACPLYGTTD